jgi:hypothetical protein
MSLLKLWLILVWIVSLDSIYVALSGRVFEGLASDNLLHFSLNAVYAQSPRQEKVSALIGSSLALYMVGIPISSFLSGLLSNFTASFFIALGLFAVSIVYLQIFVRNVRFEGEQVTGNRESVAYRDERVVEDPSALLKMWFWIAFSPLKIFRGKRLHLLIGMSLFFYNLVQSYVFTALLVHTSVYFGFTSKENGLILSIASSVAAMYIFAVVFVIPTVSRHIRDKRPSEGTETGRCVPDLMLAIISLGFQIVSLVALGLATRSWQIYCITATLAFGLCAPSFIKAYFVSLFEGAEKATALAALAMMETLGSVLGPIFLGSLQVYLSRDAGVFYVAAGLSVVSLFTLATGLFYL